LYCKLSPEMPVRSASRRRAKVKIILRPRLPPSPRFDPPLIRSPLQELQIAKNGLLKRRRAKIFRPLPEFEKENIVAYYDAIEARALLTGTRDYAEQMVFKEAINRRRRQALQGSFHAISSHCSGSNILLVCFSYFGSF
jgi:hypothetical protein